MKGGFHRARSALNTTSFTDMAMPKMTGEELSKQILKIRSELSIIICTGYSQNFTKETAMAIGIKEYVNKPVEFEKFLILIRKVLNRRTV